MGANQCCKKDTPKVESISADVEVKPYDTPMEDEVPVKAPEAIYSRLPDQEVDSPRHVQGHNMLLEADDTDPAPAASRHSAASEAPDSIEEVLPATLPVDAAAPLDVEASAPPPRKVPADRAKRERRPSSRSASKGRRGQEKEDAETAKAAASSAPPRSARKNTARGSSTAKSNPEQSFAEAEAKRRDIELLEEKAFLALDRNDVDKAKQTFEAALRLDQAAANCLAGRGSIFLRQGNNDAALEDFTAALKIEPNQMIAMNGLGDLKLRTGDPQGAIELFNQKLALVPTDGKAFMRRSEAKLKLGDKAGAIQDLQAAVRCREPNAKEKLKQLEGR